MWPDTIEQVDPKECDRILFGMASIGGVFYALMCGMSGFVLTSLSDFAIVMIGLLGSLFPMLAWIWISVSGLIASRTLCYPRTTVVCGFFLIASLICTPCIMLSMVRN